MFNLFEKKITIPESDIFTDFMDMHSHILPGVDDGVTSVEDSLYILNEYEKMGVKKVTFTPHIMENFPLNNANSLRTKFEDFKQQYKGNVELSLAAEYMIDGGFNEHLSSGEMLTLFDNYVLVETSYVSAPLKFKETLQNIMSNGYFVVLAHPERYAYMSLGEYEKLKDMQVLFQLNLMSVVEGYGKEAAKKAAYLLKTSAYDFIGTDIHSPNMLKSKLANHKLSKKIINQILSVKERENSIING